MESGIAQLDEVCRDLSAGKTAKPVTVRDFLSWFGAQRRTTTNVWYINNKLSECKIQTVPNYLETWVDGPITFELLEQINENNSQKDTSSAKDEPTAQTASASDPSFKIERLAAAKTPPVAVKPGDTLQKAMTILLSRNFSQLPVMTSEYSLKGAISWSSIGERTAIKCSGDTVQDFMTECQEVSIKASIFRAIQLIKEHEFVVVRDSQNRISGIITASDVAVHFEETSTPFLLLSEIENNLRIIIDKYLSIDDIKQTCSEDHLPRDFTKVSDLTLGNCVYIIDHHQNWDRIGLHFDKATFIEDLKEIARIRNEVMHFDPDPLKLEDIARLQNVTRLIEILRRNSQVF